jgi:hypothetical protein
VALTRAAGTDIFFIPEVHFAGQTPKQDEEWWWYQVRWVIWCRECRKCGVRKEQAEFERNEWHKEQPAICARCVTGRDAGQASASTKRKARKRIKNITNRQARRPRAAHGRGIAAKAATSDSDENEEGRVEWGTRKYGIRMSPAHPRNVGRGDDACGGEVVYTIQEIRTLLRSQPEDAKLWLTTGQMGWALTREENEVINARDEREGKPVARQLAPIISKFIRAQWESEELEDVDDERRQTLKEAAELDHIWGVWEAEEEPTNVPGRWIRQPFRNRDDMRHRVGVHASHREKEWESPTASLIEKDPEVIHDVDIAAQVGRYLFLDEKIPRHESGQGYVRVVEHSIMWKEKTSSKIFTYQRLTTCTEVDKSWTIMSSTYNHVRQKRGENKSGLGTLIRKEVGHQDRLEATGYRSPTWRVLRALQSLLSAVQLQEESAVTATPFFPSAGRGTTRFWGNKQGLTVFLWEGLGEGGREESERVIRMHRDWVVWSRARPMKGDRTPRGFEHAGKAIFCGKVKCSKKEEGENEAEDEIEKDAPGNEVDESGRACRQKGWWKRGDVEAKLNTVNMTAWVIRSATSWMRRPLSNSKKHGIIQNGRMNV